MILPSPTIVPNQAISLVVVVKQTSLIIDAILVSNNGSVSITFSLYWIPSGYTTLPTQKAPGNLTLAAGSTYMLEFESGVTLATGDTCAILTTSPDISAVVFARYA